MSRKTTEIIFKDIDLSVSPEAKKSLGNTGGLKKVVNKGLKAKVGSISTIGLGSGKSGTTNKVVPMMAKVSNPKMCDEF